MAVLLALGASSVWGYSTFLAATVSRRVSVLTFVLWSQFFGLVPMLFLAPLVDHGWPPVGDVVAGLVAGIGSGTSFIFLYFATRDAPVGIVASVASVVGSISPVLYAYARGSRPPALVLVGIALAVLSIVVVVSTSSRPRADTLAGTGPIPPSPVGPSGPTRATYVRGVLGAAASGLTICIYYVAFSYTSANSRLWPVMESRVASSVLSFVVCAAAGARFRPEPGSVKPALLVALSGVGGSVMYIFAADGEVSPAVVALVNLSPAITVLLGWLLLKERLSRPQAGGLGLAALGVALVVAGRLG